MQLPSSNNLYVREREQSNKHTSGRHIINLYLYAVLVSEKFYVFDYILEELRDLQGSYHDSAACGYPCADLRFQAGLRAVQSPQLPGLIPVIARDW